MKTIALEEHFWTPGIRDALNSLPSGSRDASVDFFNKQTVDERLLDLGGERLKNMDEMGIELAVLSCTTPATQPLSPER